MCAAQPRAAQTLDFSVAAGASLEWLPQESILFDGAVADMRLPLECQIALRGVRDAVLAAASADARLKLRKIPPVDVVALLAERFAVPRDMADLLRTMLRWAPSERTTAVEALKHPALGGSGVGVPA